jgi:HEAT repeat protein
MKRIISVALVLALGVMIDVADETTEVYKVLYQQAQGLPQKYAAILNIVGLNDKNTAPVLASALEELLLTQDAYSATIDQELYGKTITLLCKALGDYKDDAAAASLWTTVQDVPDPLAKAEALISIGKLRDRDYAERIALKLRDLNFKPTEDTDAGEKIACGCIVSLGKLKDVRGFSPVFFATDAWYSQRVRQQASESLSSIVDDPTDAIEAIIKSEPAERQLRALTAETHSRATNQRKIDTAVLALNLGHLKIANDKAEAKSLCDLRKLALCSFIAYKATGADPVDGCLSSYTKGFDDEEKLLGLAALGINGSDSAATVLRDILLNLNNDQQSGIADETRNRLAKAGIDASAVSKNKIVKPVLVAISINEKWSGGIIAAAQTAIKALQ